MLILALETSTESGSCALWRDGVLSERICPPGRSHSETLLPLVRELLDEARVTVGQLDAIAFGAGPGAFTGLRVACGAAQGLAAASGRPLVAVCGLEAMATATGAPQVLALLDARMGEVYAGRYVVGNDGCILHGEIQVVAPEALDLPAGPGWLACGNALTAYPALAARLLAAGMAGQAGIVPTAAVVGRIAAGRAARGEVIDAALAAPLYVRDKVAKTVAERLGEGGRA